MNERPDNGTVRVRFAPSPTGALHLGSALVAVANAAFARASGGTLVLRIDDTDEARSDPALEADLVRMLTWLGIDWDEGPVRQSERLERHRAAAVRLEQAGAAYPCFCGVPRLEELRARQVAAGEPPRYDGRCRGLDASEVERLLAEGAPHVLRFAVPAGRDVVVRDEVRGEIEVPAGSFGDPVLLRGDGRSGYLLASVVDDEELAISHVLRGEDHLTNTARQVLLHEALGAEPPRYAHLPLLRGEEGSKLSKREPLGTLDELVDEGFEPRAVRRYLGELLGQGDGDPLAPGASFDLARIPVGAPKVDRVRLESLGRQELAECDVSELLAGSGVDPDPRLEPLVLELAAHSASHVALRGELRLVLEGPGPGDLPVVLAILGDDPLPAMRMVEGVLDALQPTAVGDEVVAAVRHAAAEAGIPTRAALGALRVASTGRLAGPPLQLLADVLGSPELHVRTQLALQVLERAGHARLAAGRSTAAGDVVGGDAAQIG